MKIRTVTYHSGYKLSHNYNSVEGQVEATAEVEDEETAEEAYRALRSHVRQWLRDDYSEGRRIVGLEARKKNE